MSDPSDTRPELIKEISALKKRIQELKQAEIKGKAEDAEMQCNSNGIVKSVLGVSHDITEYKQTEEKLKKSEEKYRNLVENTTDWVWEMDSEGRFIYTNNKILDFLGYTPEEIIGKTPFEFAIPEHAERSWKIFHEKKPFAHLHDTHRHRNGNLVTLDTSGMPIFDDQRRLIMYRGVTRDITELKNAEEAFKKSEERFRRIAENSRDMIYRMSLPDGKYEYVSPVAFEMTGYSPEEYYHDSTIVRKVIHPDWQNYFLQEWEKLIQGEAPFFYEYKIIHKSGVEKWLNQRNVLIFDSNGHTVAIEGIVTDITQRKNIEEQLKEHRNKLEELVKKRTTELQIMNEELYEEIVERKKIEDKLKNKSRIVEELNIALKVLLQQIKEDKKSLEQRLLYNIKNLVLPYLEKTKTSRMDEQQRSYLAIMETNLNEIVSPFLNEVLQLNLSPRETQTASLIKDGKTTKEIASIMGVAPSSVDFYRKNIRDKLNLTNQKVNLQSYLRKLK
jgi:PAS domain S-box-containing protein